MENSANSQFVDYYELLGVKPNAEINDIRKAYIVLAKQHHPDAGGTSEMMKQLNTAYRTLTSQTAKGAYDMLHSFHVGSSKPSDYRYMDGREVGGVNDFKDDEVDAFLDSLLSEYRNGVPKEKQSIGKKIRKFFDM